MSDNRNDAFSSYQSVKMKPKNITSDMWAPITASGNYTAYVPERKEADAGQAPKKTAESKTAQRSDRGAAAPKKRPEQKAAASDTPQKKRRKPTAAKADADRPISSGREDPMQKAKKRKTKAAEKVGNKYLSKVLSVRLFKNASKKRDKTNKAFLKLVRSGKSVDEARSIITRRKIIKRKLSTVFGVIFLFFFATLFVLTYTYCEGAEIANIIIDGDEVYSEGEILSAAQLSEGVNMLTVREKDVNENVTTVLPFISVIGVDYELPDTLRLNVVSTSERFIIKNGSRYFCVDKTGKVVSEKKKKLSKGQYLVQGMTEQTYTVGEKFEPIKENSEKFEIAMQVALAADSNEIINTGVINVKDIGDITLTYKSRLRVYLGNSSNLPSKLSVAETVMLDNKAQNKTGYINAKYDIGAYFMQGSMDA
ncbi:MAG: FtsQ-type POTRA domain-containing protein [Clostridia bacterium]|nr:FtsQ-type POTRA domain-containing protein [Clostridia bacterium]